MSPCFLRSTRASVFRSFSYIMWCFYKKVLSADTALFRDLSLCAFARLTAK